MLAEHIFPTRVFRRLLNSRVACVQWNALENSINLKQLKSTLAHGLLSVFSKVYCVEAKPNCFWVEVSSPDEIEELTIFINDWNFNSCSIGIADGPFAAWCAAQNCNSSSHSVESKWVPRGEDKKFLAPLSISYLPVEVSVQKTLRKHEIDTLGKVAQSDLQTLEPYLLSHAGLCFALASGIPIPVLPTFHSSHQPYSEIQFSIVHECLEPEWFQMHQSVFLETGVFTLCEHLFFMLEIHNLQAHTIELSVQGAKSSHSIRIPSTAACKEVLTFDGAHTFLRSMLEELLVFIKNESQFVERIQLIATESSTISKAQDRVSTTYEPPILPLDVVLARIQRLVGDERVVTPKVERDAKFNAMGVFTRADVSQFMNLSDEMIPIELKERLRTPSSAIGSMLLSRAPQPGDPWPVRAIGPIDPRRTKRVVAEVCTPEVTIHLWNNQPCEIIYQWVISNDGIRALFARATAEAGWKLIGVAD